MSRESADALGNGEIGAESQAKTMKDVKGRKDGQAREKQPLHHRDDSPERGSRDGRPDRWGFVWEESPFDSSLKLQAKSYLSILCIACHKACMLSRHKVCNKALEVSERVEIEGGEGCEEGCDNQGVYEGEGSVLRQGEAGVESDGPRGEGDGVGPQVV